MTLHLVWLVSSPSPDVRLRVSRLHFSELFSSSSSSSTSVLSTTIFLSSTSLQQSVSCCLLRAAFAAARFHPLILLYLPSAANPFFFMPSILSDVDKETVKRLVPKPANKIIAVAVARLYIAFPDPERWTYTGLQGAVVLANDLVGQTMWLKMVDVSVRDLLLKLPPHSYCLCVDTFLIHLISPLPKVSFGTRRFSTIFRTPREGRFSTSSS